MPSLETRLRPLLRAVGYFGADATRAITVSALFKSCALQAAHPAMASWPADHAWFIGKLEISHLWLINIFGGATNITPDEYYAAAKK